VRINRFLALAGLGSRRSVETLVTSGRITINGEICLDLARQVGDHDDVRSDNKPVRLRRFRYFAFNKPPGFICTRSDDRGRDTIYAILPRDLHDLEYVGRLDKDSEGLLLLTNDGGLAQRLTNPKFKVEKEYEVTVDRAVDPADLPRLVRGTLIDGVRARATRAWIRKRNVLGIVLEQGLKRQIRVMLERLRYEVGMLRRIRIGPVTLGRMPRGAARELSARERDTLLGG
jgi:23S rRNA pseudouridine2605 synthase